MYEAAHFFSFSLSLTNIQIHNLHTNTGYSGDFTVTHMKEYTNTDTISIAHTRGS